VGLLREPDHQIEESGYHIRVEGIEEDISPGELDAGLL
jgi:hypothetical protein